MTTRILTQAEIKDLVDYDPETGIFVDKNGTKIGAINNGYLRISLRGKVYQAHRIAWAYIHGVWPSTGIIVDHINCNRKDNRIANLRLVNHRENMQNKIKPQGKNPYLGVRQDKFSGKWCAGIYSDGKHRGLGSSFTTPEEARDAYIAAKRIFHKGFVN